MCTLLRSKWVMTRKRHRCFGCNRIIPRGSRAHAWASVEGGDVGSGYDCQDCHEELTNNSKAYSDDGCIYPGSLIDCDYARWPILEAAS